ncbi:MAG: glycosyltransferase family 4 protein [Planctomycetales bacterium]|nr:glycosyltransferase family 4 protein [Planctomycetales bacterium]
MRIAFVSFEFGEYCVRHVAEMSGEHDVLLVLPHSEAEPWKAELAAVDWFGFDAPRLRQPWRQWRTARQLLRRIHAFQPDVVHFQSGHLWFNWALPRLRRYPLVLTVHDARHHVGDRISQKTPQFVLDYGVRQADQIIVHSRTLTETLTDELGVSESRVHVVPHVAIGQQKVTVRADKDDRVVGVLDAFPEEPHTLLFFGRIWEYKGLEYLIRAEPIIAREIPDVRIIIAGTGEDFDRYRRLMTDPDRYEVHNCYVSDALRSELFQRSAVVVLPYIEATQSGVVPVAYAHRRPVIATRTGGLPEVVEDQRTGLLVPPRDAESLASAAIRLLRGADLRRAMGIAGYEKLNDESSPDVVARLTLDVYRQAIQQRRPTASCMTCPSRDATENVTGMSSPETTKA